MEKQHKLNKQQRHLIYEIAWTTMYSFNVHVTHIFGLCYYLREACNDLEIKISPYTHPEAFPEIFMFKPRNIKKGDYWFIRDDEGLLQRLVILDNAISLTK